MADPVYDLELGLLTEYLEGPRPSFSGLVKEATKLGLVKSTLFRYAITSTGETIEFIARRLGLTDVADRIAKTNPYVDSWGKAIVAAVAADNMPAFQFLLRKRGPEFRIGKMSPQDSKDVIAALVAVGDKPDSRFTLAMFEVERMLGVDAAQVAKCMSGSTHIMRVMIYNGIPKPWRTQAMMLAHFPNNTIKPEVWKAYETTCAHWTPARHWLFPPGVKQNIKTLLTLGVTLEDDGSRQLITVLGMLSRELMYHLINMYLGLVCA